MLKFTNVEKTAAEFNGAHFSLKTPEDWDSIGDGPTREAVKIWLALGNIPIPYEPPVAAKPVEVSMRQARLALLQAGLLENVNLAIQSAGQEAQIEWEFASTVKRESTLVSSLSYSLGLTEQQLDDLFALASSL